MDRVVFTVNINGADVDFNLKFLADLVFTML